MSVARLIIRSLRYYARVHLGAAFALAVSSAVLTGALLVGDSVRQSLRDLALARLGPVHYAMSTGERTFLDDLGARISGSNEALPALAGKMPRPDLPPAREQATVLSLVGTATRPDATARANPIHVLGVDPAAWPQLAGWNEQLRSSVSRRRWESGEVVLLNAALARQLNAHEGHEVILRVQKPAALGLDAAIAPRDEDAIALRLRAGPIIPSDELGDFSLLASTAPALNAFLPLKFLASEAGVPGRANLIVIASADDICPANAELNALARQLSHGWKLEDAGLSLHAVPHSPAPAASKTESQWVELTSSRVFIDPVVADAALGVSVSETATGAGEPDAAPAGSPPAECGGKGVLTYLANLIWTTSRAAPYSMITAAGAPLVPTDMRDDEIIVNDWLARDLEAKPGDSIRLSYFIVDSASRLIERTNCFRLRAIVPLDGIYADHSLMPDFPGLAKAESTHDWDAGFPLVYKIRQTDEQYWREYRGTPKAFITLRAGQQLWGSRFGEYTAIRYAAPPGAAPNIYSNRIYQAVLSRLHPDALGMRFEPVREQALKSAAQGQDFGQLFLGLSFFLVVAALLLSALVFQFGVEQRASEVGTLLALGFRARRIRVLLLAEGCALAVAGGAVGAFCGIGYAKAMVWALTTLWRKAVGDTPLQFHFTSQTLIIGFGAGLVVAAFTIWLTLRKQARQPARELLAEGASQIRLSSRKSGGLWTALIAGTAGLGCLGWAHATGETANAEIFFSAGTLILVAGLGCVAFWLGILGRKLPVGGLTLTGLSMRGCARRRTRSLATVALLASGTFLVVAMSAFRLDARQHGATRASGTGGFALIGRSVMPIVRDLNSARGQEAWGLDPRQLAGVNIVPFRVHEGDDASCLNLNHPRQPRLLGVKPDLLRGRFTFASFAKGLSPQRPWELLKPSGVSGLAADEIPAIGDANSIQWSLGKKLGDTLEYTDEQGRPFKVRLVGAVANSILQGSLLLDEAEFVRRFPSTSGYGYFLIDTPPGTSSRVSALLSLALEDTGLALSPAVERLDTINAVQNTYLSTFQILGGLGLLLGSAGLGAIVLRTVFERRGELALLTAVGLNRAALRRIVLGEHTLLLGLGLGIGVVAAGLAVLHTVMAPGMKFPFISLGVTLGLVLVNGFCWILLATRWALRGNLVEALRNE